MGGGSEDSGDGGGSRTGDGSNPAEYDALYSELWHACAGPDVYVPRVGEKVYYFLQGHVEQVKAYMKQDSTTEMPIYNLPPKILCEVVNVRLMAEPYTDEVFAQLTLIAMTEKEKLSSQDENFEPVPCGTNSRLFYKTLTPSDTSTHGGFSVPRRLAEECLPPLDMAQEPPTQEVVAKDLHGFEWRFRHIFRGQPKRHLLTSGWSIFLSSKKLVAGDTFIFLRGENGELRVGVRHVTRPQNNVSGSVISGLSMQHGILANAFHAISTGSIFNVYSRPWTNPSEFLVPYDQYMESTKIDYFIGSRVRLKSDSVECQKKRIRGTIVGVGDFDRKRWPGSEWRCLKVQWDDPPGETLHPESVNPWNIEPLEQTNARHTSDLHGQKRSSLMQGGSDHTAKKQLSSWVLQGQEGSKTGLLEPDGPIWALDHNLFGRFSGCQNPFEVSDEATTSLSNSESPQNGFSKIMIFGVNLVSSSPELPSQQVATSGGLPSPRTVSPISQSITSGSVQAEQPCKTTRTVLEQCKSCCFSSNRTCTKVLKYGSALGRSIDLARFDGYVELISKLDDMFDFKGSLIDKSSGWHVTYTDNEGDMMLAGDFPWLLSIINIKEMDNCKKLP